MGAIEKRLGAAFAARGMRLRVRRRSSAQVMNGARPGIIGFRVSDQSARHWSKSHPWPKTADIADDTDLSALVSKVCAEVSPDA